MTTTGEPATHTQPTRSNEAAAVRDLAATHDRQAAITPPGPGQSHCDIEPVSEGVRVRCRRVPLEPGITLTHHQWTELHRTLVGGQLPDFAVELPNSWVTRIAPPGQEHHALYLWRDEIAALAHELRTGRHLQPTRPIRRSTVEGPPDESVVLQAGGLRHGAAAGSSPSTYRTPTVADQPPLGASATLTDAEVSVLDLSPAQVDLLTAMAVLRARIVDRVVRVGDRRYSMHDLYTLRTAKLIRPCRDGRGLRDRKRFELTARGAAEAHRLAGATRGDSAAAGMTRAALPGRGDR
ncbi:hypothetical protein [Asanoa siamensis]|uniref:Uncharacterized protein n=1 Tax=Asanoa siamensis TaxID=926357 RepID=A0ABQ4CXB9_9ACTN|nr:hypothetical protein [Asanoa siamensis]GIF75941.1 hypothetical protein Asi02nite_54590 [Asanoa siamensis]